MVDGWEGRGRGERLSYSIKKYLYYAILNGEWEREEHLTWRKWWKKKDSYSTIFHVVLGPIL